METSAGEPSLSQKLRRFARARYNRVKRFVPYATCRLRRQLRHTLPVALRRGFSAGKRDLLVGITVSTNYSDLLGEVLASNLAFFDHWVIVTQESDVATRQLLEGREAVTVLFWDPRAEGRTFDKGTAIRIAQEWAYREFPDSWYLILDSDISLPKEFHSVRQSMKGLPRWRVFGASRRDYHRQSDFLAGRSGIAYKGSDQVYGYFQLYALPVLSDASMDASWVDIDFRDLFPRYELLPDLTVAHLGAKNANWKGRGPTEGFVFDAVKPGETSEA